MLLRVVPDLQTVPGLDLPGVGTIDSGEDAQQCRLPGAVETQHDNLGSAVDREVDIREDLQRSVRLRQAGCHERRLAARCGLREAELGDAVLLPHLVEPRKKLLGSGKHLVSSRGLCRLGPELRCLLLEGCRLLLGVRALLLAAFLVGHTLAQVVLPRHVVDVDDLAIRIEIEDPVDGLTDELDVVRNDDQAALVVLQELPQPHHTVGIQVVRRLIEDHRLRVREEDAREFDATALTARKRAERLVEDAVGQRQVVGDRGRLGFGGVPAERLEALGERSIPSHGARRYIGVVIGHREACLVHPDRKLAEAPRIQDAGAGQVFGITRARILGQVPELPAAIDASGSWQKVAREHLCECRLACTIAAYEPDLVARAHTEGDVRHEHPGAHANLEVVHGEHSKAPFHSVRRVQGGRWPAP